MYQSIPKRVYTTKESAMPQIPIAKPASAEPKKSPPISKTMEADDLLLIGLLLLLLSEDGDHQLLIAVVAFLLFF